MRNVAASLLLAAWAAVITPNVGADDNKGPIGKTPEWGVSAQALAVARNPNDSSSDETPNQRRRRLGLPIVASYPAPDYGQKEETPNERRRRLGLPIAASDPAPNDGVREETPNQRKHRLASARTSF